MMGQAEFVAELMPHREVMAMLAARLAPHAVPGTVARDAYALAVRRRSDFDPHRTGLRTWLLAITAHGAEAAEPGPGLTAASVAESPGAAPSIERSAVEEKLDALPDRQRFAVECVHFVGLSVRETAELMRVSERSASAALADGQRRIRTLLGSDGGPGSGGGGGADQLSTAGSAWRAAFREEPRTDLDEPVAPQVISTEGDAVESAPGEVDEAVGPPIQDAGSPPTEPRPRRWIRTRWALIAIGVVVLVAGGTVAALTAKRAAEFAAEDQAARAYQMCGQIPPGLTGVTVRRLDGSAGRSFQVRVVANRPMNVVEAKVTGVDDDGRIATYYRPDPSAKLFVSAVMMEDAGYPMVITASTATDRCDGSRSGARGLTNHLLLIAVGGGPEVMDAGPVDQLSVGEVG